ncbi:MAG: hypothetical protein ACI8QS_001569 [Planctomycetota bacterium]|jgi:hypothetical protein
MTSQHVTPMVTLSRSLRSRLALSVAALGLSLTLGPGCHIRSYNSPPRIVGTGIVRGHAALGFRDTSEVLRANVSLDFDQLVEVTIWKLFRLEVGVAGASVGIGPFDLGIGVLFYDPEVPQMVGYPHETEHEHEHADSDDECCSMEGEEALEDGSSFGDHDHSEEIKEGGAGSADMAPVN